MDETVRDFLDNVTEARDQINHYHESGSILVHTSDIFVLADDIRSAAVKLMDKIKEWEHALI